MLRIDIKTKLVKDEFEPKKKREEEYVIVNGIADEESFYSSHYFPSAHFYNEEVIRIITSCSFKEVGSFFTYFGFNVEVNWWQDSLDFEIYCNKLHETQIPCVRVNLQLSEWENWAKPWSMADLAKQFELNVKKIGIKNLEYWQEEPDSMLNGFGILYYPSDLDMIIKNEVDHVLDIVENLVVATNKNLLQSIDSESVITYFQFPDEIKTACSQYLIYFTQFIADMGIFVDTELKQELNLTLFKVIPKDKNESLEKVKEALNIYLNAPNEKNFQVEISNQDDIAAKQWEANIFHLKSQLSLAKSIMQAKDATIESLQLSNYQYKQLLEKENQKTSEEDIIKDVVSLKKFEGKIININLPEIFRRLKRNFLK